MSQQRRDPVDETIQLMERAHRTDQETHAQGYGQSIVRGQSAFQHFAQFEEQLEAPTGDSLYSLVDATGGGEHELEQRLRSVKSELTMMERKRMLALGAHFRLDPEEAAEEVNALKQRALELSLRAPLRADFIVHGHNVSLTLYRLFEAAERAEGEIRALIDAKRALDAQLQAGGGSPQAPAQAQTPLGHPMASPPQQRAPAPPANPLAGQVVPAQSPLSVLAAAPPVGPAAVRYVAPSPSEAAPSPMSQNERLHPEPSLMIGETASGIPSPREEIQGDLRRAGNAIIQAGDNPLPLPQFTSEGEGPAAPSVMAQSEGSPRGGISAVPVRRTGNAARRAYGAPAQPRRASPSLQEEEARAELPPESVQAPQRQEGVAPAEEESAAEMLSLLGEDDTRSR
ncbi:MAG: hypothetical protein VYD19_09155 [Myxococcota bacterium]|nr:hypothetical protein [Myxococcota bacterium]